MNTIAAGCTPYPPWSVWQGERDTLRPVSMDEAKEIYESLHEKYVPYEQAFGETPEEA